MTNNKKTMAKIKTTKNIEPETRENSHRMEGLRLTDSQRVTGTAFEIIDMFDTNFFKNVKQIFFGIW